MRDRHDRVLGYEMAKLDAADAGPPEYQPDEEPTADDIGVLYAAAAYEMTTWEWIWEQEHDDG